MQSDNVLIISNFIKLHYGVGWREIFKNLLLGRWPVLGAKNEWRALAHIFNVTDYNTNDELFKLVEELFNINDKLWNIEDRIRLKEKNKEFDNEFIQLARSVYITNDKRAEIKKKINELTPSSCSIFCTVSNICSIKFSTRINSSHCCRSYRWCNGSIILMLNRRNRNRTSR